MSFLEIKNLQKKFYAPDGSLTATITLPELNLDLGQQLLLTGTSGCGKSTVLHLIAGLIKPDQGTIICNTINLTGLSSQARAFWRAQTLGYVFQNFNLLPRATALENVELPLVYARVPARERRPRALAALERVGLSDRTSHRPNQLSGGQQQRVAIARALVGETPLILADEPTGNLDTATSTEIMELFTSLNRADKTIVLVTHEPDVAAYSSRTIRFQDGRVIADERGASRV